MKGKQAQILNSFAVKMPNSKYISQKKKLTSDLNAFRNYFNYNKNLEYLLEPED